MLSWCRLQLDVITPCLEAAVVGVLLRSEAVKLVMEEGDGKWQRGDKVERSAGFYVQQSPACVCCLNLSDDFVTKTFFFCRDSIWVMLIQAGVWDL